MEENKMKEFIVDVPNTATKEWGERELINIAYGQMETLRDFGFDAAIAKADEGYLMKVIDGDGQVYADCDFYPTVTAIAGLAQFVECVQVQEALNSMTPRMAKLGWYAYTDKGFARGNIPRIQITLPGGAATYYEQTNASMLQLSLDLDKAEVEWELGQRLGLFHKHGWQFIRWTSGDGYSLCKKRGLGHSDQVLHIHDGYLEEAWEAIDKIESEIKQAEPAEKVAKIFE